MAGKNTDLMLITNTANTDTRRTIRLYPGGPNYNFVLSPTQLFHKPDGMRACVRRRQCRFGIDPGRFAVRNAPLCARNVRANGIPVGVEMDVAGGVMESLMK